MIYVQLYGRFILVTGPKGLRQIDICQSLISYPWILYGRCALLSGPGILYVNVQRYQGPWILYLNVQ